MGYKELTAILILWCVIGCNNNNNPVVDGNNSKPIIQGLTFRPDPVVAGQSCLVTCTAVDSDGDNLSYEWESVGNIAGSGSNIFYTPNACCGAPLITVTVKDSKGGRTDSTFTVPFIYE